MDRLRRIANATTINIFLALLLTAYKTHGRAFTMPNAPGVNRDKRHRALLDLEKHGLVSVQRNRGRPALIRITTVAPDATPTVAPDTTNRSAGHYGHKLSESKLL